MNQPKCELCNNSRESEKCGYESGAESLWSIYQVRNLSQSEHFKYLLCHDSERTIVNSKVQNTEFGFAYRYEH